MVGKLGSLTWSHFLFNENYQQPAQKHEVGSSVLVLGVGTVRLSSGLEITVVTALVNGLICTVPKSLISWEER